MGNPVLPIRWNGHEFAAAKPGPNWDLVLIPLNCLKDGGEEIRYRFAGQDSLQVCYRIDAQWFEMVRPLWLPWQFLDGLVHLCSRGWWDRKLFRLQRWLKKNDSKGWVWNRSVNFEVGPEKFRLSCCIRCLGSVAQARITFPNQTKARQRQHAQIALNWFVENYPHDAVVNAYLNDVLG